MRREALTIRVEVRDLPPSSLVGAGRRSDGILDELPLPVQIGAVRTGGIDLNKPRMRAVLATAAAPAPSGFTVADFAARVQAMTAQAATAN